MADNFFSKTREKVGNFFGKMVNQKCLALCVIKICPDTRYAKCSFLWKKGSGTHLSFRGSFHTVVHTHKNYTNEQSLGKIGAGTRSRAFPPKEALRMQGPICNHAITSHSIDPLTVLF